MITVESTANPVYSNASGDKRKQRQIARTSKRANRKAKRLKRVKLRSGKTANVYVLTKLSPKKASFDGFSYLDDPVALTQSEDFVKTNPDGTTSIIKKEDVVKSSTGAFYDKNEVAKVYGVDKSVVTQQMIDRITVAVTPTGNNPTSAEEQKTVNSDLGIVVNDNQIELDVNGQPVLKIDNTENGDNMTDEEKAILAQQEADAEKKKKMRRIVIIGGITIVAIVVGVIVYRRMSKGGK
jgi:hypothetical protein